MAARSISGLEIVDATVDAVTTAVQNTDDGNSMDIIYIGEGQVMIVEATNA